jgi:hypothetical protein
MSHYRIKICDYFDKLINKVDFVVEISIIDNQHDEDLISSLNKKREAIITEIRQVEAFNLKVLSIDSISPDEKPNDKDLFKKFCFFIESTSSSSTREKETYNYDELAEQEIGLKLIVTERHLTEDEITCFKEVYYSNHESKERPFNHNLIFHSNLVHVCSSFI